MKFTDGNGKVTVLGHLLGLTKKSDREKFNRLLHDGGRLYVLDEIHGLNLPSQAVIEEAWKRADAAAPPNDSDLIGKVQCLQFDVRKPPPPFYNFHWPQAAWARFANEQQKELNEANTTTASKATNSQFRTLAGEGAIPVEVPLQPRTEGQNATTGKQAVNLQTPCDVPRNSTKPCIHLDADSADHTESVSMAEAGPSSAVPVAVQKKPVLKCSYPPMGACTNSLQICTTDLQHLGKSELLNDTCIDFGTRTMTMHDSKGKAHECRLALGAFIADLQEQWEALGLRYFRDVSTLATKDDMISLDSDPPLRHEEDMKVMCNTRPRVHSWEMLLVGEVTAGSKHYWCNTIPSSSKVYVLLAGDVTLKQRNEVGFVGEEVALWGFANTDIYQCTRGHTSPGLQRYLDASHRGFKGMYRG
ncbi:hypothetical protein VOLCADRAFT_96027 [Volvox carteri f. nagariensis]|uniref:Uncharacterized protein n=1 Tax=Volvox carteri f. nagariensis TaxID=3068 RepID=D8U907_VOLCA|nr:uncharacterized protein VOLCADRAFT_96027 [Volvox carteri f. nagariensis]EFJ43900.1 hypothetical protein VOLCADRAFT_96027 [Volvox carteri f. nagariensis]|eukprot:XP_002955146.1 hypothetical protein VOLCADRAFT_96027 [Volvox carteri f. nagariensis]